MNIRIFSIAVILSLPLWWLVNIGEQKLESFLFSQEIATNPQILTAQAQIAWFETMEAMKPIKKSEAEDLKINSRAGISLFVSEEDDKERTLWSKNSEEKMPIASLTKLMTALVVLENYDLSEIVEISQKAVNQSGDNGSLKVGEIFTVRDLLYPLLMESSNDAAYALAEVIGREAFVDLMNLEVQKIGMKNTSFGNPTGLDADEDPLRMENYSTVKDLVKLVKELIPRKIIWNISLTAEYNLYSSDNVFHHKIININELLEVIPEIVGGKTGYTEQSGGCLFLLIESPRNRGYIINILLGSPDRFFEMEELLNWIKENYKW